MKLSKNEKLISDFAVGACLPDRLAPTGAIRRCRCFHRQPFAR